MGGKGSWWSQVSHRKLKISISVASILGDTAKDALLKNPLHCLKVEIPIGINAYSNEGLMIFKDFFF